MGEFIVNNLQTLANERATSQAVIDKHNAKMKQTHPFAFAHPDTSDQAEAALAAFVNPPEPAAPAGTAGVAQQPTLQDVQAEIARRKTGKVATK